MTMRARFWGSKIALVCYGLIISPSPAIARQDPIIPAQSAGRVAETSVGEAGQRKGRESTVDGINPTARINNRIANRVQNRLRNRIDRYSSPLSSGTSAFEAAIERGEGKTPPRR
jgi:hypothetical protein